MSVAENKALVQRLIQEVFLGGDRDAVDRLVTPDFESHGLPGVGPDVLKGAIERTSKGLTDVSMEIADLVGEDDRVAVRIQSSATQSGELMGMPPSGRTYTIEELHLFRIADGRIAEHWHQMDAMGMMRQLGAMPGPKAG